MALIKSIEEKKLFILLEIFNASVTTILAKRSRKTIDTFSERETLQQRL